MKRQWAKYIAAVSLVLMSFAGFAQQQDPYKLVQDVASATFDRIKTEQSNINSNPEVLRDIMEQELLK